MGSIQEAVVILGNVGVSMAGVAAEIEIQPSSLCAVATGKRPLPSWYEAPLQRAIKRRALLLSNVSSQQHVLRLTVEKADMKLAQIGKRMGVSRQAVQQFLTRDYVSQEKLDEIQVILRDIGKQLEKISR